MKKYFYSDGATPLGPFTLEELGTKNITKNTKVWFEGLGDWKYAGDIHELEIILKTAPPPIINANQHSSNNTINNASLPKTWLIESILATLFCCLPFGILGIIYASKVESRFYVGDVEGANKASADAKKWTMISLVLGLFTYLFVLILSVASEL